MKNDVWLEQDREWRRKLAERQNADESIMETIFMVGVALFVCGITAIGVLWAIAEGWMR